MNALKFKGLLCSAAAVAGFGCSPQSAEVEVPPHVAYCLDDPAADKVAIMSTVTGDPVYLAARPQAPATASPVMNLDGTYSKNPTTLAVDERAGSCTTYGRTGPASVYTRFSSSLTLR